MKKIVIIIKLLCLGLLCHSQNVYSGQSTMSINEVNLTVDSILNEVINDAYRRMSNDSASGFYSVLMNGYKGGTLVKAVKTKCDTYEIRDHWEGYAEVDSNKIVIDFGISKFRPVFITTSEPLAIELKRFDDISHIMDIKYYYILDDTYAIYFPESGWIWSDGKPDE